MFNKMYNKDTIRKKSILKLSYVEFNHFKSFIQALNWCVSMNLAQVLIR